MQSLQNSVEYIAVVWKIECFCGYEFGRVNSQPNIQIQPPYQMTPIENDKHLNIYSITWKSFTFCAPIDQFASTYAFCVFVTEIPETADTYVNCHAKLIDVKILMFIEWGEVPVLHIKDSRCFYRPQKLFVFSLWFVYATTAC